MLASVGSHVGRVRVTLLYAVVLAVVAEVLLALGPDVQSDVVRKVSTNLHNLGEGRIETLIGSAFVNADGPIYLWLPGFMAVLALGELLWQGRRMVAVFVNDMSTYAVELHGQGSATDDQAKNALSIVRKPVINRAAENAFVGEVLSYSGTYELKD